MEDDIERFEEERELELYREYRDVLPMFTYVIETERRFYLANKVDLEQLEDGWVQVELTDAWVWDMFRPARFVSSVRVMTRRDVNVEELRREDATTSPTRPRTDRHQPIGVGARGYRPRVDARPGTGRRGEAATETLYVGAGTASSRATGAAASASSTSSCSAAVCS